MKPSRVLIIDDDDAIRFGVRSFLEQHDFSVNEAATAAEAEAQFVRAAPAAAILDFALPDGDALGLIPKLKAIDANVPILVLTGNGSIDIAVNAIKLGAEHFLTKPVELPALLLILQRCLEAQRLSRTAAAQRARSSQHSPFPFIGDSAAILQLAQDAQRIVNAERPILILGDTGCGKGVMARWLHAHGPRANEAFVELNCAGLSREFLESELFGHERGAFTGAVATKPGLLEVAHHGTVFLDELGDMDLEVQPRLLKALEEKRIRRLGETREREVDIVLIAATHHDLATRVAEDRFRRDLYFRLSALPLRIPALRERREDIVPTAKQLLTALAADLGRPSVALTQEAQHALSQHDWPGNIRELRNVLERAVLFADTDQISAQHLRFDRATRDDGAYAGSQLTLAELEKRHIEKVLEQESGHVPRAAMRLGIPRSSLYQRIKTLGLEASRFQTTRSILR